ncbi:unnamed protein product [Agarophyton chilense]
MDPETSVLRMSATTGADCVHMGTVVSSSTRLHKLFLRMENTSPNPLNIVLSLSEQLRYILSLVHVAHYTPESDTSLHVGQASISGVTQPTNSLSLKSPVESQSTSITLPADSNDIYELQLTTQNAWKPTVSNVYPNVQPHGTARNAIPFSGHLLAVNVKTAEEVAKVKLSGSCCESWLQPQVCVLHFAHCIVETWTYRDLSVRNKSQLSTVFSVSVGLPSMSNQPSDVQFRFVDPGTGSDLNPEAVRLDARSIRVVRVGFLAFREGSNEYWLSIQNLENADNFWHVRVLASPKNQLVAHGIHISCGETLDFADCYAYRPVIKEIEVRNSYSEAINIALLSDNRDEISYETTHDWDNGRDEPANVSSQDDLSDHGERVSGPERNDDGRGLHQNVVEFLNGDTSSKEPNTKTHDVEKWSSGVGGHVNPLPSHVLADGSVDDDEHLADETQPQFEENISLRPGQARQLRVWYVPKMLTGKQDIKNASISDVQPDGKLQEKSFQLLFVLPSGERRIVSCSSRVCESNVQLEQSEVHLGNCNLLTTYTSAIRLINCSDMPAALSIHYVSRCVVAASRTVCIEPRQTYDLSLSFVPLHVNPKYHKEISITNERNPNAQKMVFTLRANCVDRRGISFHAVFYSILAPKPTNEVEIGIAVANHPAIRAFRIRNETQRRLVLRFENFRGMKTYASCGQASSPKEALESLEKRPHATWKGSLLRMPGVVRLWGNDPTFPPGNPESNSTSLAILDPNIKEPGVAKRGNGCLLKCDEECGKEDSRGLSQFLPTELYKPASGVSGWDLCKPLQELINCLDGYEQNRTDSIPTFFENHEAEKKFANKMFRPVQLLHAAIADGCLSEANAVSLEAKAQCIIIVSLRLSDRDVHRTTKLRVIERRMKIRMLEFDQERLGALETEDPKLGMRLREAVEAGEVSMEREVPFTMRACKSTLSISPLSHLNFGIISVGEQRDKAFNIVNLSEVPLLYEIRKSGGYNSGDLRFNLGPSSYGAISPYFTKVVPFIYAPTVEGRLEERIIVKNRLDESADREIVVKAFVVKSRIIWEESDEDD